MPPPVRLHANVDRATTIATTTKVFRFISVSPFIFLNDFRNAARSGATATLARPAPPSHGRRAPRQNILDLPRLLHDGPPPAAKSAVGVDGVHPFVQKPPLDALLLSVLPLCFQNQLILLVLTDYDPYTAQ